MKSFDLKGKVAVVTGGYGHLGQALSLGLLETGAKVIVAGRKKTEFARVFGSKKKDVFFEEIDISSTASIKSGFKQIVTKYRSLDVLVNNAFYSAGNFPDVMSDEEWALGIDGTLNSVFRCVREVIPHMKRSRSASIINISSMYGVVVPDFKIYEDHPQYFNPPNYGVAKAGVIQLTRYYANFLAGQNIRVNCISPGAFPAERKQNKEFVKKLLSKIPLKRIGHPDDLKGAVVFLASQASSYMTGQNLVIDGGWTIS